MHCFHSAQNLINSVIGLFNMEGKIPQTCKLTILDAIFQKHFLLFLGLFFIFFPFLPIFFQPVFHTPTP